MRRLHAERELRIDAEVSPTHEDPGAAGKTSTEMLGNLLDNALQVGRAPESPFRQPSTTTNS